MAYFKNLIRNVGQLSKQVMPGNAPISSQEIGMSSLMYGNQDTPESREAVYPNWFFSAHLGQPRNVDTQTIRTLAKSPWTQMVLNTFKKQVASIPWEIVPADEEDETDRTDDIQAATEFFNKINENQQCVDDINSEIITDIGEIDAGCLNYVYTADSYDIGTVPVYDAWGRVIGEHQGLVLKPLGQRKIVSVKSVDGSSMLKQVDIHKNLLQYWQYSFKHPRQNPTRFQKDEIVYLMMNPRSYDVYGFSPVQAIQQVLELLIQGTRYNKDLYTNNAIPDVLISLPKLPKDQLRKLKRVWNNNYKGKPHQVGFINWMIDKITKLSDNNRDLEWLEGQKWYFRLCFGVFGVSPEEAGFTSESNNKTGDNQERVTIRNALKPYLKKIEQTHTTKTLTEFFQRTDHGLKFKYFPKDHVAEKIEFEQDMKELEIGALTINEYRRKKGKDEVEWGDEPLRKPFDPSTSFANFVDNPQQNPPEPQDNEGNKHFKKNFERYLNDRQQRANS